MLHSRYRYTRRGEGPPLNILGIVAEYDPFHLGHLYHITEAKTRVRPDLTFVVLSPCIKQRGTLSLLSPADRARCALQAGADAVFALPVLWTVRDAEHYALGSVSLLARLGVTHLAFGAEAEKDDLLARAADLLESPPGLFRSRLKAALSEGAGYPAALSRAVSSFLPEAENLLNRPNNILAVSYLRAIRRLALSVTPVVIRRTGDYHAPAVDSRAPSASALRDSLLRGSYAAAFGAMPGYAADLVRTRFLEGRIPDEKVLDALLIARLRSMSEYEYRRLPDLSEGLENALREAAAVCRTREELIGALSGRRYPAARISRLCACALLRVTEEQLASLPLPSEALLLGLRKNPEMTALWKARQIPVVPSFTEWKKTAHPADPAAWSLWALCCGLADTLPFSEKVIAL